MTISLKNVSWIMIGLFYLLISCTHEPIATTENEKDDTVEQLDTTAKFRVQKYGKTWIFYAEVDKAGDYFRRMFIEESAANALKASGKLPENALIAMETWFGNSQSTVYLRQNSKNGFLSGSFSPTNPNYTVSDDDYCNRCHVEASATLDTYTLPLLEKAVKKGTTQYIVCDKTSFNPCDLSVYRGN